MPNPDSTTQPHTVTTLPLFNYDALEPDTRVYVQDRTVEIRALMVRAAQDIVSIGGKLTDVKSRLQHGQFGAWIEREFQMSAVSAWNFMRVYTRFGDKSSIIEDLNFGATVLYLLAAPSVPDEAVESVLERARAGEHITVADVREAIDAAKPAPEPILFYDEQADMPGYVTDDGKFTWIAPPASVEQSTGGVPRALQMSESNEWYTPAQYIEAARRVMNGIDLDPASNPFANETVQAAQFYTQEDDGLAHDWIGRVWLNPPYGRDAGESNQGIWSARLIAQYESGRVTEAVMLVNAVTDRVWFQPLWNYTICFTDHRIRFYDEVGEAGSPTHGNVLVYFGPNVELFVREFTAFGRVVPRGSAIGRGAA